MFSLTLTDTQKIDVQSRKHTYNYAMDGSLPNPLEATYAALAACAGVYTHKAAKKLNKSVAGIQIECKSVVSSANPLIPAKWVTEITFTAEWNQEEKQAVIDSVAMCAVKELIAHGQSIEFVTVEK
ncbi:MAG: hypothetical protein BroJett041_23760 [Candidatus Jettenia caeni]|nr:MAG: hypothetical protein BroJett041_23760 [Candidatus Jettenia caeni]